MLESVIANTIASIASKNSVRQTLRQIQRHQHQQQHQLLHKQAAIINLIGVRLASSTRNNQIKRDASTQAKHQAAAVQPKHADNNNQRFQQQQQQQVHRQHQHQIKHQHPHHHHQQQQQYQQIIRSRQHAHEPFTSSELEIIRCSADELNSKPSVDKLLFGHAFTDHMFRVDWDSECGWYTPLISKVHNLDLHPGAKVLHYALEAFEGAKAFRGQDNKIRFFRLDQNIKRLLNSAKRLSLPLFDEQQLINCIHKLVELDQDWIPESNGQQQLTSLYVRPTILGVEPSLGVASSKKAILYVLLSPVGPYFKTGFKPISLYADPDFVRAWPGGAGNTKLGSNYAPTIMVQKKAEKMGLQQVLWLYGDDAKLTEVGTMNVFVSYTKPNESNKIHLVTPPLTDGLILPGITRASILELARQWDDVIVEERYPTIKEVEQLLHENRLVEMFGAGTACIVCPISSIQMKDGAKINIPYFDITSSENNESTEKENFILTKRILGAITDIQYGKVAHPWSVELNPTIE